MSLSPKFSYLWCWRRCLVTLTSEISCFPGAWEQLDSACGHPQALPLHTLLSEDLCGKHVNLATTHLSTLEPEENIFALRSTGVPSHTDTPAAMFPFAFPVGFRFLVPRKSGSIPCETTTLRCKRLALPCPLESKFRSHIMHTRKTARCFSCLSRLIAVDPA